MHEVRVLANLVNGCKDDLEGQNAKVSLVKSFIGPTSHDLFDIMCWLHALRAITLDSTELLKVVRWKRPLETSITSSSTIATRPGTEVANARSRVGRPDVLQDASRPGLFVASALEACMPEEMAAVVEHFVITSSGHFDCIDMLRYVSRCGFVHVEPLVLLAPNVTDWKRPPPQEAVKARWNTLWEGGEPSGPPTYVNVRDARGRRASIAFLGSAADLHTPADICRVQWNLAIPSVAITCDAGSTHPRMCDSINMMCNLPQYAEWVAESEGAAAEEAAPGSPSGNRTRVRAPAAFDSSRGTPSAGFSVALPPVINLEAEMRKSIEEWQQELEAFDTDAVLVDGSINNLIYMKLKGLFSSLLDAATLSGAWLVVDRTGSQSSATAELLLELALERGASRPVIVAVDSLERLGSARDGQRAHAMLKQLCSLFHNPEGASQAPNGTEHELQIDWMYTPEEFDDATKFIDALESRLPFPLMPEHGHRDHGETLNPHCKWGYFFLDGIFANATHYIIKNNNCDEFDLGSLARQGFLYAHGDTRTFKSLRSNIQQGKAVVMLHNSGGATTAFSWLQRVMQFSRPPPSSGKLSGPLKFLIATLSRSNWVRDFGVPEVLMMRSLAERAPALFRKHVISVDILTDSEQQAMELITGCFAAANGAPEVGVGNAEISVIFNAWNLHALLCANARGFLITSMVVQSCLWTLSLATTAIAISMSSLGTGFVSRADGGKVLQAYLHLDSDLTAQIKLPLEYALILLPIMSIVLTTISARLLWRDKVGCRESTRIPTDRVCQHSNIQHPSFPLMREGTDDVRHALWWMCALSGLFVTWPRTSSPLKSTSSACSRTSMTPLVV